MQHYRKHNIYLLIFTILVSFFYFHTLKAGVKQWLVLQTTFEIDLQENEHLNIQDLQCGYCGSILVDAQQDFQGTNICKPCGEHMQLYLQSQDKKQPVFGDQHCAQLADDYFPDAKANGVNIDKISQALVLQVKGEHARTYEYYPDPKTIAKLDNLSAYTVECKDCDGKIPLQQIVKHATSHKKICSLCDFEPTGNIESRAQTLEEHAVTCAKTCKYCHTPCDSKENHKLHEETCSNKLITCEHCEQQVQLSKYSSHCIQQLAKGDHPHITCSICNKKLNVFDYQNHFDALHKCDANSSIKCNDCDNNFPNGEALFTHSTQFHSDTIIQIIQLISDSNSHDANQANTKKLIHVLRVLKLESSEQLEEKNSKTIQDLSEEIKQLKIKNSSDNEKLSKLRSDFLTQSATCQELQQQCSTIQIQQNEYKVIISELELQLQAGLSSTYNGTYIWRIPNVETRKKNALDKNITSLYSPPFYTATNGCKMCLRAYINGDGIGYQTHLSIFIVLMKGEFDPLLKWPFEHRVSFMLLDQSENNNHICQTFKPSSTSSSFKQPTCDMNIASGCPKFCELKMLNPQGVNHSKDKPPYLYVKDDVLYIKCIVNTNSAYNP